jgi:hypothetical protein
VAIKGPVNAKLVIDDVDTMRNGPPNAPYALSIDGCWR